MEEKKHVDNVKLNQLRADIQAGIASGDAGTLDADEIKRRGRARHADALRETERRKRIADFSGTTTTMQASYIEYLHALQMRVTEQPL